MMIAGKQERQDADQERPQWACHGSDAHAPDAGVPGNAAAAPCEAATAHGCVLYVQVGGLGTFIACSVTLTAPFLRVPVVPRTVEVTLDHIDTTMPGCTVCESRLRAFTCCPTPTTQHHP